MDGYPTARAAAVDRERPRAVTALDDFSAPGPTRRQYPAGRGVTLLAALAALATLTLLFRCGTRPFPPSSKT